MKPTPRIPCASLTALTLMAACQLSPHPLANDAGDADAKAKSPGERDGGAPTSDAGSAVDAAAVQRLVWRSGQRLKARTTVSPEGEKLLTGWWDKGVDRDCRFVRTDNDRYACVSLDATTSGPAPEQGWFADAACTQPILVTSRILSGIESEVVAVPKPTCSSVYQFFKIGKALATTDVYFAYSRTNCSKVSTPARSKAFELGESVPADRHFVTATVDVGKAQSGLAPVQLKGEDGSVVLWGFHDVVNDVRCSFRLTSDGEHRCTPDVVGASSVSFSDASCTNRQAVVSSANECDVKTKFINQTIPKTCPLQTDTHRNAGFSAVSYGMRGGMCTEDTSMLYQRLLVGEKVPLTDFIAGKVTTSSQSARLRLRELTSAVGSLGLEFFDSMLGETCRFGTTADGIDRCLPGQTPVSDAFADAACTKPAYGLTTCQRNFIKVDGRVFRTGTSVAEPYAKDAMGVCQRRTDESRDYFELGAAVPLTDLVPLRQTLED
ncbi:MAG TPA: hypothetical protein VGF45_20250 [Polyangia bacterium]